MRNRIVRYDDTVNPFWALKNLEREMDRFFGDGFDSSVSRENMEWAFKPSCDVVETPEHFLLTVDLPGINRDNISIEVKDNRLLISGERSEERREDIATAHLVERVVGKFSRNFSLPTTVNADRIEAAYQDGVLRLSIPKAESSKARKISVKEGSGNFFRNILGGKKEGSDKNVA